MKKSSIIFLVVIILINLLYLYRAFHTTLFYDQVFFDQGSADAYWFVKDYGFRGKNWQNCIVVSLLLLLNAIPFIQWTLSRSKTNSNLLPIYRFKSKILTMLLSPLTFITFLVIPLTKFLFLFGSFPPLFYEENPYTGEMVYGFYYGDGFSTFYLMLMAILALHILWVFIFEIIYLIRYIVSKKKEKTNNITTTIN